VVTVTVDFFFFSSRRRHTRLQGDWSSDVCSSDLASRRERDRRIWSLGGRKGMRHEQPPCSACRCGRPPVEGEVPVSEQTDPGARSEERRVGKECRSRWSQYH